MSWTGQARDRVAARFGFLDRPLTDFYLVLGITTLLLALGLVMVLSTSSAAGLMAGGSPWSGLQHQLLGVLIGLPCMWLAARSSPSRYRAAAYPLMFISLLGLVVVLFVHPTPGSGGAARWLQIGGFQFQPSELAKFAFLLWGADLLARKEKLNQLTDWRQLLIPLLPGVGFLAMLVMLGDDLGTTFVLLIIFLALLWIIGTPGRVFAGILLLIGLALLAMVVVAPYRMERLLGFFHASGNPVGRTSSPSRASGRWARAAGSASGSATAGRSGAGCPSSTTDFIFAILGEELGLVGTLCVTFLYAGLAYAGLRIARRVQDTFMRLAAGGATAWIVGQALVNICAVHRAAADYRRSAAAGLRRAVVPAGDHGGARHADVFRQAGARRQPGPYRGGPRSRAARPKLAWPGRPAQTPAGPGRRR